MLWYSLEAPRRGASNEYPQHMFLWRNKKDISIFRLKKSALSVSMTMGLGFAKLLVVNIHFIRAHFKGTSAEDLMRGIFNDAYMIYFFLNFLYHNKDLMCRLIKEIKMTRQFR